MSYLVNSSYGPADLERATVPFILACSAANRGEARVFLTGDALHLVVKGNAKGMVAEGYTPVADLIAEFVEKGGIIWVCKVCASVMGISAEDLIDGAEIGGAPNSMDFIEAGGKVLL
ncbi:MAG: DsrE family protein [Pseudomonadota bacterium]